MENGGEKKVTAWFMGPKGERGKIIEEILLDIWRDYVYWRKNYFPQDGIAFTMKDQREVELEIDKFHQILVDLLSKLKRNFPFYSPRYIAHMLSEITIPSMLGYFAGMIYNPNNVTPEAAPVTVELEIEAINKIMKMLGYNPPPDPPSMDDKTRIENYENHLKREFGWGHIVPGGTLANLEALWVASLVRYSIINIKYICNKENIGLIIKLPDGNQKDIRKLEDFVVLTIKPNEAIYSLSRFILAVRSHYGLSIEEALEKANELLEEGEYNLNKGIYKLFEKYPPVIFVSRTAHYSIEKAASILGIGKDNVVKVDVDSMFRMKIDDLRDKMERYVIKGKKIPVAIITIAGTTEEGAVDPIHKIVDLRKEEFEKKHNISFWIHIDAAWGGFFRSLIEVTPEERIYVLINKLSQKHEKIRCESISTFLNSLVEILDDDNIRSKIENQVKVLLKIFKNKEYDNFLERLTNILTEYYAQKLGKQKKEVLKVTLNDRIKLVQDYVRDSLKFQYVHRVRNNGNIKTIPYEKTVEVKWGYMDVISAFLAFPYAESITIDPHKLGYVPYPCGMVTYRNDRVRHFILQKAPYITSSKQNILLHNPPKHLNKDTGKVEIDAFAPFIIEGSRPGASATSLWLSVKTIPLNKAGYGLILKFSLLASRELYEWLNRWNKIMKRVGKNTMYDFIPITLTAPDTNIVIFSIKAKNGNSLTEMNTLTKKVYESFTIQSELGEQEYSYSQPFFLSKTVFHKDLYPFNVLENVLRNYFDLNNQNVKKQIKWEYEQYGLFVLRATVMNPYICYIKQKAGKNLIKEFVEKLEGAAIDSLKCL